MPLLDLPPEIFQNIIGAYVANLGMLKAWKTRQVCKTFDSYITEEVLGRQPWEAYRYNRRAQKLLEKGLLKFLELRSIALHGYINPIPKLINSTVTLYMKIEGEFSRMKRVELTKLVAQKVVQHCPQLYDLVRLRWRYSGTENNGDKNFALCVAILLGETALVEAVLAAGASAWGMTLSDKKKHTFGTAISTASRVGNVDLLRYLLQHPRTVADVASEAVRSAAINDGVMTAQSPDVAVLLIRWHFEHLGRPKDASCKRWMFLGKYCFHDELFKVPKCIFEFGTSGRLKALYRSKCLDNGSLTWVGSNTQFTRLLLDEGVFSLSACYKDKNFRHTGIIQSVLGREVSRADYISRRRCVEVITAILEAGADPNGGKIGGDRFEYPLRHAVQHGPPELVQLLLDYGADPEAGDHAHIMDILNTYRLKTRIHDMMFKAIREKRARLGQRYPTPTGRVWKTLGQQPWTQAGRP